MFLKTPTEKSMNSFSEKTDRLRTALKECDSVIIGAGAGLSTSAGFTYDGERFKEYFSDFEAKYGFKDMYSGGFYPYEAPEEYWAFWSRYIYINRYLNAPKPVYENLLKLVKDKDYFVITTNVDHCFQKAGFDKKRLFYTQGDYGLFQCSGPCCQKTYDNETVIRKMLMSQGYVINADGTLLTPENSTLKMTVSSDLIPYCPNCGRPMTMNLRCDDKFAEDEGWHDAALRYENFLRTRAMQKVLLLELGVGYNTPGIIKYSFWQIADKNPNAIYVCINRGQAACPSEISEKSVCIDTDIGDALRMV